MSNTHVKHLVIAGGGTAGWMTAAAVSKLLPSSVKVTLVESDDIATVGVGEATIPPIRTFHKLLGIDELEFMQQTQATFKLGIEFSNWKAKGDAYIHSFGVTGKECWAGEFHHFYLRALKEAESSGATTASFGDYCYELQAAKHAKFLHTKQAPMNFAYHLDATAYAKYLRGFAEKNGIERIEGKIIAVEQDAETGNIQSLSLNNGQHVKGDFFIDCTGFRALLIDQALRSPYEDWSQWLFCDSAYAVQTHSHQAPLPYTKSIAHDAGWQWQIPLQHRVGNGLVFSSHFWDDKQALDTLISNLPGDPINEPRKIAFTPGVRPEAWRNNCLAIGLSSGFIEPLESTSIHLIMTSIVRFMRVFPFDGVMPSLVNEFNQKWQSEMLAIRDFIVMHYKVNQRNDSEFWRACQQMAVPDSLAHKLQLFEESARVFLDDGDIFRVDSWTQVLIGQGLIPRAYHRIADEMPDSEFENFLGGMLSTINHAVTKLPIHETFLKHNKIMNTDINSTHRQDPAKADEQGSPSKTPWTKNEVIY